MTKVSLIFMLMVSTTAWAQTEKKDEIRVRIEREENGKRTITEKIINTKGMSPQERQRVMDSVQDSLGTMAGNRRIRVSIEDSRPAGKEMGIEKENELLFRDDSTGRMRFRYHTEPPRRWEFQDGLRGFQNRMRVWGEQIPRRMDELEQRYLSGNPPSIRIVDVFTNQPQTHIINVNVEVPNPGDVTLKLLDIKGKTVIEQTISDVKDKLVTQLKLAAGSKGTYFLLVTQNNDGVTRRVVVE